MQVAQCTYVYVVLKPAFELVPPPPMYMSYLSVNNVLYIKKILKINQCRNELKIFAKGKPKLTVVSPCEI